MRFPILLCCLLAAAVASAHGLDLSDGAGPARVVTAAYDDGGPFSFERYEVYRPDESVPFQVGHTDRLGRVAFLPDAPGLWRVRVFSEDGHGGELSVDVDALAAAPAAPASSQGRDIVTGVAVLFGLFGLITLFARRK